MANKRIGAGYSIRKVGMGIDNANVAKKYEETREKGKLDFNARTEIHKIIFNGVRNGKEENVILNEVMSRKDLIQHIKYLESDTLKFETIFRNMINDAKKKYLKKIEREEER